MSNPAHPQKPAVVWLITDRKPGHVNQLKGIGNRLRVLAGAELHWLVAADYPLPLWRTLLGRPPSLPSSLPPPALVIAAGTGTHRLLLALRRSKGCRTVVLMKPGFPLGMVDAAIIPRHDGVRQRPNLLLTEGMINTITPMARLTDKPEGLILVGGPSRHYQWEDETILEQIASLMSRYPAWRWTISASRRTPGPLRARLEELAGPKVTVADPDRTHEHWLSHQLAASRAAWVTPDSSSMVFEAATSGVPTGVFELEANPDSRVARGVNDLASKGHVAKWSDITSVMDSPAARAGELWEADRAAKWLIRTQLKGEVQ